ncbi:MAG: DUF2490 domain-containing protein [Pseudomonadota bacterium]
MRIKLKSAAAGLAALFVLLTAQAKTSHAGFDPDNQLWMRIMLSAQLTKMFTAYAWTDLRFGDDVSEAAYIHAETGLQANVYKGLLVGMFYRQVFNYNSKYYDADDNLIKAWDAQYEPGWFLGLRLNPGRIVFLDLVRMTVPVFDNDADTEFRLRHVSMLGLIVPRKQPKMTLVYMKSIQEFTLHPNACYRENRLMIGLMVPVKNILDIDIFYMWVRTKHDGRFYDSLSLGLGFYIKVWSKKAPD